MLNQCGLNYGHQNLYVVVGREQKIAEIRRFFGEKSDVDRPGKENAVEKSNGRKSEKNWDKSAIFREQADFCSFVGPCCARAEEAHLGRFYRRFIDDKFKISMFSR